MGAVMSSPSLPAALYLANGNCVRRCNKGFSIQGTNSREGTLANAEARSRISFIGGKTRSASDHPMNGGLRVGQTSCR